MPQTKKQKKDIVNTIFLKLDLRSYLICSLKFLRNFVNSDFADFLPKLKLKSKIELKVLCE